MDDSGRGRARCRGQEAVALKMDTDRGGARRRPNHRMKLPGLGRRVAAVLAPTRLAPQLMRGRRSTAYTGDPS
jgi:hypothetical protein